MTSTGTSAAHDLLYDQEGVRGLFDRMSGSYDRMNLVMSLGFSALWRRQLVSLVAGAPVPRTVLDMMSGRGETWTEVFRRFPDAHLTAIDFAERMVAQSALRNSQSFDERVLILGEDALSSSVPDGSIDVIVSAFGLKTFDVRQSERLAEEVARILRPGGAFAFIDVTEPPHLLLRFVYATYLRCIVPIAGMLLLSDPTEYRMLHRYLAAYGDGSSSVNAFARQPQLQIDVRRHFFGCATSISGRRR
ncbi:class I SAM-dependent methyltransferase [Microbacterium sp. SSM24]|uniref:class I SAM-dependent methyltransferase n=1 Tax=Microbacterium sp. SSM24 TaxID=2991714 RepID=UPI0022270AC8|nr:class I SAM-dependent methyltransferase [Microbacterium sp. SSM24]MCW3492268.1 class I SAM-dependent methyltransferase [Microbacterium sp. SSM24]